MNPELIISIQCLPSCTNQNSNYWWQGSGDGVYGGEAPIHHNCPLPISPVIPLLPLPEPLPVIGNHIPPTEWPNNFLSGWNFTFLKCEFNSNERFPQKKLRTSKIKAPLINHPKVDGFSLKILIFLWPTLSVLLLSSEGQKMGILIFSSVPLCKIWQSHWHDTIHQAKIHLRRGTLSSPSTVQEEKLWRGIQSVTPTDDCLFPWHPRFRKPAME